MIESSLKKNLQVRVELSRRSGGDDLFSLRITDAASGLLIVEANLDNDTFADLMSNRGTINTSKAEYYPSPNIGKRHEHQSFQVPLGELPGVFTKYEDYDRDMMFLRSYAEEKNPGWAADREKYNSYKRSHKKDGDTYSVILRRYVSEE